MQKLLALKPYSPATDCTVYICLQSPQGQSSHDYESSNVWKATNTVQALLAPSNAVSAL